MSSGEWAARRVRGWKTRGCRPAAERGGGAPERKQEQPKPNSGWAEMMKNNLVLSRRGVARRGELAVLQLDPGLGVDFRLARPRVLDALRGTHAEEGGGGGRGQASWQQARTRGYAGLPSCTHLAPPSTAAPTTTHNTHAIKLFGT